MSDKLYRERVICMEMPDILDSIAHTTNSFVKKVLEDVINRPFNGWMVTNMLPIAEAKYKGRHPKSVLEKDNPFLSFTYMSDVEYEELSLGASSFTTDVGNYIDPEETSDLLFSNSDHLDDTKNIDIRLQGSNVEMNCSIAVIEDTEMCQMASRRAWDILHEAERPYTIISSVQIPLNEQILIKWCTVFGFEYTVDNLPTIMKHMQERSEFQLTLETRTTQNKEWIFIRIPMQLLYTFDKSEVRGDGDHHYITKNFIVSRNLNVKFNAPTMYWIIPKDKYPRVQIREIGTLYEYDIEYVNQFVMEVDKTENTIELPILNELGESIETTFNLGIHKLLRFDDKNNLVASLRSYLWEYESFILYCISNNIPFDKVFYILIREADVKEQAYSLVSTDKVGITYTKDFLIKLLDTSILYKALDVKIYIDMISHVKFLEDREQFMHTDYSPYRELGKRDEEPTASQELIDLLG